MIVVTTDYFYGEPTSDTSLSEKKAAYRNLGVRLYRYDEAPDITLCRGDGALIETDIGTIRRIQLLVSDGYMIRIEDNNIVHRHKINGSDTIHGLLRKYVVKAVKDIIKKYPLYVMERRILQLEADVLGLTNLLTRMNNSYGEVIQLIEKTMF